VVKKYELVVMFPTSVNDVVAEKNIADKCDKAGIDIVGLDKWGVKVLAYPINKQEKAYYLKYDLETESSEKINELEKALKMDESLLRHLLVGAGKFAKIKKKAVKSKKTKKGKEKK
jgi:small subunit ribosomal protein S6